MVYLQQFNYTIEYQVDKKMPHINYLSRNPINEVEELEEIVFVGNVTHKVTKFSLAFIYNYYRSIIFIRIGDHMKGLYQLLYRKRELSDKTTLDLILRELRKETGLVMASERIK